MLAMMGLLARNGTATGQVLHHGRNLLGLPAAELNAVRGDRIAMIFQDPMTSLNPYLTRRTPDDRGAGAAPRHEPARGARARDRRRSTR